MNHTLLPTKDELEKLKEKHDLDDAIAKRYDKPKGVVGEDLNPYVVFLVQKYLRAKNSSDEE